MEEYLKYSKGCKRIYYYRDGYPFHTDKGIAELLEINVKFYRHILRRFNCDGYNNKGFTIFRNEKWANQAVEYLTLRYLVIKKLLE